jgi:hypothetical protein
LLNGPGNALPTVQFQKNRSYHRTIDQSPYSALFGSDPNVGLSSSAIPKEILDTLETEEDLNALTTTETPANRNDTNQTTPEAIRSFINTGYTKKYVITPPKK